MKQKTSIGQFLFWLLLTAIIGISCFFIGKSSAAPAGLKLPKPNPGPLRRRK